MKNQKETKDSELKRPRIKKRNQITVPIRSDVQKNKVKLYFKQGGCTMCICKNVTRLAADNIALYVDRLVKDCHTKLEGSFLIAR